MGLGKEGVGPFTYLTARVPRCKCDKDGVKQVQVPWRGLPVLYKIMDLYLEFADDRARRHLPMTKEYWAANSEGFLNSRRRTY